MNVRVTERPRAARPTARSAGGAPTGTARSAGGTIPAQRGTARVVPAPRSAVPRQRAAAKAYARRDQRARRLGGTGRERVSPTGRTPFVVLVMCLLAVGLVATLWLSTSAAADSYRLQEAHAAVADLTAQSERLRRDVAGMKSPTALAARAAELGMVPAEDPARIVVAEDGEVTVVGDPKPARAPAPPAPPADPAPADGAAPPPGTDPAEPGAPPLAEGTAPTGDTAAPGAGDDTAEPDAGAAEAPDPDSG